MQFHSIRAVALIAAAVLVVGVGSALARASGGTSGESTYPNASCTSANPCLEEDNKSTGSGLTGTSLKGTGVIGKTSFLSTSSSNAKAGVLGQDTNVTDIFNAGVLGTSKKAFGVMGVSTNGNGVFGKSTDASGVSGSSANGVGIVGSGSVGAVFGQASSASGFGIEGVGFQGVVGQNTSTTNSDALLANGFGGNLLRANNSHNVNVLTLDDTGMLILQGDIEAHGVYPLVGYSTGGKALLGLAADSTAIAVEGAELGGPIFRGINSTSGIVFLVTDPGNVYINGQIYASGSCINGCSPTKRVRSYLTHESVPMSEDVGEAQLVGGRANVRLDPAFANVIDRAANYLVFITPEGDNRGLYVTNKSPAGFDVRESQGGQSTLAFSYRIVAKPYGKTKLGCRWSMSRALRGAFMVVQMHRGGQFRKYRLSQNRNSDGIGRFTSENGAARRRSFSQSTYTC